MSDTTTAKLSARARELRAAFDATFAQPPPPPAAPATALLLVQAGGERFALQREELGGFLRAENFTPAPGRSPAFLGLAGLRGGLFPVWSLALLLGHPVSARGEPRWLALTAASRDTPCAFACEGFERMIFVPETALSRPAAREAHSSHVLAHVAWAGELVPVLDLRALQALLKAREPTPLTPTPS